MEKYIPIMKQSVELSDTILEGLQHIQKLLSEGKREQTVFLFEDVLVAYSTIGQTIEPVIEELKNDRIRSLQADFSQVADLVVAAYEEKNYAKVQEVLQFTFIPQFKRLQEQLEQAFRPYLLS